MGGGEEKLDGVSGYSAMAESRPKVIPTITYIQSNRQYMSQPASRDELSPHRSNKPQTAPTSLTPPP